MFRKGAKHTTSALVKISATRRRRAEEERQRNKAVLLALVPDRAGIVRIPLTQGKVALVDSADLSLVAEHKWWVYRHGRTFYAETHIRRIDGTRTLLKMHRLLLNPRPGFQTDHIDGDGLNNIRANLRAATTAENQHNQRLSRRNTSGYKGVSFNKQAGKFKAEIRVNGPQLHLGYFTTAEDAHAAYSEAAARYHGEFARLK